ncbi:MAG: T9SS type A sorting domain-containing protein [Bacteroidia bacterium]|nr:T9SS type A sorting domain-containing protein [Bacteroidia bacterium]
MNKIVVLVIITGFCNCFRISAQVNPVWSTSYTANLPLSYYQNDMVSDASGNIYVSGYYQDTLNNSGSITLKYNESGFLEWVQTFDSVNYFTRMAIDDSSNIYITGNTRTDSIFLIKYNASGVLQWNRLYGNYIYWNWAYDIITDDSDYVYVAGLTDYDKFTALKYDRNGNLVWAALDSTALGTAMTSITIDQDYNIYFAARGGDTSYTCNIYKYNRSGIKQWERVYKGNYNPGYAAPVDLQYDHNGFIYMLAATTNDNNGQGDYSVVKYDTAGNYKWQAIYSATEYYDVPMAMALDNKGNVYATGNIHPGNCINDAFATVKFDSSGIFQWAGEYTLGYCNWDIPYSITVDSVGYIYVSGVSADSSGHENFATIKYNSSGNIIRILRFHNTSFSDDEAHSIIVCHDGNICVSGTSSELNSTGILTIKYANNDGIREITDNPETVSVYPNPTTGNYTINLGKYTGITTISVSDITGKMIEQNEYKNAEIINLNLDKPNGIYILKVNSAEHITVVRLIKE